MLFIAKEPKNFVPYLEVSTKFQDANDTLILSEFQIHKLDNGYVFVFLASKLLTVYEPQRDLFKPDAGLYAFHVHSAEYEKNQKSGDTWTQVKVQPSEYEAFLCDYLDRNWETYEGKSFEGKLNVIGNEDTVNQVKAIGDGAIKIFLDATEIEASGKLVPIDAAASASKKKSGGGYSRGQTEYEKLTDRWKFVCEKIGIEKPSETNLLELIIHIEALVEFNPNHGEVISQLAIKLLMTK